MEQLEHALRTERVAPQPHDRVAILRKGVTVKGVLLAIHSNKHLYTVRVDGEYKPITVQWWQVTKLHVLFDVVQAPPMPVPVPWWKRWLRFA